MRSHAMIASTVFTLCLGAATAQTQEDCKSRIDASPSQLDRIEALARGWKGSQESLADFRVKSIAAANTLWTCTRATSDLCCKDIPLKIAPYSGGESRCPISVEFPYGRFEIKRDGGQFKPWINWKLTPSSSPPDYVFSDSGIDVDWTNWWEWLRPLAVESSGSDKCGHVPAGNRDDYRCKSHGKKSAETNHWANVYPKANVGDPNWRCVNIDPIIVNTN